jgi:hypothetical protein
LLLVAEWKLLLEEERKRKTCCWLLPDAKGDGGGRAGNIWRKRVRVRLRVRLLLLQKRIGEKEREREIGRKEGWKEQHVEAEKEVGEW